MLARYFPVAATQIPDKSGFPSRVRGAEAERFGLPSLVRGIPDVGTCTHWAAIGVAISTAVRRARFLMRLFLSLGPRVRGVASTETPSSVNRWHRKTHWR